MPSIEDWLNGLGLGKYSETFTANDVDICTLPELNSADLQELGVSLGHRKIMLAAIAALREGKPQETEVETKQEPPAGAADRRPGTDTAEVVSTPQQKCIGWPEQKYISDAGKKAPELRPFVRHQTWAGLSAGVSELARRERCLL